MLCKEENVRAGRNTAAGKMKETVIVTVHKGILEIMGSSKIMDDRVVGNRRIMGTAKKMAEEECKVDKVVMDNKEDMVRDNAVITAVNKETTGASMKGMVACRVALVNMEMKDNMGSRVVMAGSKVDMVSKVAMVAMANKAVMDNPGKGKMIMMMTTVACRAAIAAVRMKTSMMIIAVKKKTMTIMRCRAAMAKKRMKAGLMKMRKAIMTGNNSRVIPAGVLAVCSTTRETVCRAWATNTDRNRNTITIATRIITVAGKTTRMKVNMVEAGRKDRREIAVWVWAEAIQEAPARRVVALPVCQEKKYAA